MIKISVKKAVLTWFLFSIVIASFEIITKGGDALIADMITPAYWMLVIVIMFKINSEN